MGKCAYCESQILSIGYGCIEHFHPKSKFPILCFDWHNLFLACDICNSIAYKGAKFPSATQGGPYVNPAEEDPELFFDFIYDKDLKHAYVAPKVNNTRAQLTESDFGLNRPFLLKRRSGIIKLMVITTLQAAHGDLEAIEIMQEAVQEDSEYAVFARAFDRKFNLNLSY